MEKIAALQSPPSLFKSRFPLSIRIWHWLTFFLLSLSIIVVIFASTLFTMKSNVPVIQEQLASKGATVTPQQARAVAHEYSDKLWMLHKYIGYGLCILLLWRIILETRYSAEQRLTGKIKNAKQLDTATATVQRERQHYILVKRVYLVFYILFFIMALSGLGLAYEDVPFVRAIHEPLENIHSIGQYLIYFYIIIHISGVLKADLTDNKGLVSDMINGGESTKNSAPI